MIGRWPALLHDVVEEHGGAARLAEIRTRFGDDVADLVEGLSDSLVDTTSGAEKRRCPERKVDHLCHLAAVDERVALVSTCDKLHNARCILADLRVIKCTPMHPDRRCGRGSTRPIRPTSSGTTKG